MALRSRVTKRLFIFGALIALSLALSWAQEHEGSKATSTPGPKIYTEGQADDMVGEGVSISISIMLIGAISFMMGLFYLVNNDDDDIRLYAWKVISQTISIFCAVLLFQACNGLVEEYLIDGGMKWLKLEEESPEAKTWVCTIDLLQLVFWLTMMQITLAITSGAIAEMSPWLWQPESMEEIELATKSFAVLLAHISGFASINAWGALQQNLLGSHPLTAIIIVPIGLLGLQGLYKFFQQIREGIALGDDGEVDEMEEAWIAETQESENDVAGLSLSFLTAQVLRFWIGGHLPDGEGKEEHIYGFHHNAWEHELLMGIGFVFLSGLMMCLHIRSKFAEDVEELVKEEYLNEEEKEEAEKAFKKDAWIIRPLEILKVYFSCGMAWCFFYGTYWMVASTGWTDQDAMLQVIIAIIISFCSFFVIWCFDKIDDSGILGSVSHQAILAIIDALGILIGFSWEQSFDVAVDVMSEAAGKFVPPTVGRLLMSCVLVLIVFPAWKQQILTEELHLREEATGLGKRKKKFEDKLESHKKHFLEGELSERELDHAHLAMKLHRRQHHRQGLKPIQDGEKPLKHFLLTADGLKDVEKERSDKRRKLMEKGAEIPEGDDADSLLQGLLPPHLQEKEEEEDDGTSWAAKLKAMFAIARSGKKAETAEATEEKK